MAKSNCNDFDQEVHIAYFHGAGETSYLSRLLFYITGIGSPTFKNLHKKTLELNNKKIKFLYHEHQYPLLFEYFVPVIIFSCLFLLTCIACIFYSSYFSSCKYSLLIKAFVILFVLVLSSLMALATFINTENPSKSILDVLKENKNVIIVAYSFGGGVATNYLNEIIKKDLTKNLLGVVYINSFNCIIDAAKNFPLPQPRIISLLPINILHKTLYLIGARLHPSQVIEKNLDKISSIPIIIVNHPNDNIIGEAQLGNNLLKKGIEMVEIDVIEIAQILKETNNFCSENIVINNKEFKTRIFYVVNATSSHTAMNAQAETFIQNVLLNLSFSKNSHRT